VLPFTVLVTVTAVPGAEAPPVSESVPLTVTFRPNVTGLGALSANAALFGATVTVELAVADMLACATPALAGSTRMPSAPATAHANAVLLRRMTTPEAVAGIARIAPAAPVPGGRDQKMIIQNVRG
jgi:hypothetical protein